MIGTADTPRWIEQTNRFYYRRTVKGGHEWMLVDSIAKSQNAGVRLHKNLAAAVASATSRKATAVSLPFTNFTFVENGRTIEFTLTGGPGAPAGAAAAGRGGAATEMPPWRCSLDSYTCRQQQPRAGRGGAGRGGRGGGGLGGPVRAEFDINANDPRPSPDGKFEALVRNYNIAIREVGKRDLTFLSTDGSEGGYFDPDSMVWSPDSQKLVIYKVRQGIAGSCTMSSLTRRPAPAEALDDAVCEAGRPVGCGSAGPLPHRVPKSGST